jgi:hypothetical protein
MLVVSYVGSGEATFLIMSNISIIDGNTRDGTYAVTRNNDNMNNNKEKN